ncbi:hypothetical protein Daus18300_001464 [Diaporthe australafricana]|uniref:Uncharacterized protein n=1 Tax=Diaporthe australafricana TaxID=127596 RepID=A0ABR3XVR8_9PEZI
MAIDVSAVSYESGRRALQLAADGDSSVDEIASLLAQEAEDHWESFSLDPTQDSRVVSCDHCRALEVAASAGHMDAVERLLAAGADPNAEVHDTGIMAIEAAAAQGHLDVVQRLLEAGAFPDYSGARNGATPLIAAARAGHIETCKALLQSGADVSVLTQDQICSTSFSAMEAAVESSSIALLELFLGAVEDVAKGFSPDDLELAIAEGRQQDSRELLGIKEFLKRGRLSINRALGAAAAAGNMLVVQRLLGAGADVAEFEYLGGNAVAAAASGGHLEVMTELLRTLSDRNISPEYAVKGALQSAVDAGSAALIEPLLQKGAVAEEVDIRRAAVEAHLDTLTLILQSGALVETIYSTNDHDYLLRGFTALHLASYYGHLAIVDLLLAKGADVDEFVTSDIIGLLDRSDVKGHRWATALQLAVAGGHVAVVKRLIDAGAEVKGSALEAAVPTGDMAMLELLQEAGAVARDGRREDMGLSILSTAAEVGNSDLVARLLSTMSLEDAREGGPWALQAAAENHHTDIVRQLLQVHPDINTKRDETEALTLLQTAAANGDVEILEMLLSEGAEVDLKDPKGDVDSIPSEARLPTALQSASERGDLAAVELLLAAGADVNVVGATAPPLLLAIRGGHVHVFEHLLDAGADIHATFYRFQTMLEAAEDSGDADIQDRVHVALDSRPPPHIDQPLDRGTGPLCETCRLAPLRELFWDTHSESRIVLHPSLIALRASAAAGCPLCCFLWKRLAITSISIPQPSPVELVQDKLKNAMYCWVKEPFPRDGENTECLLEEFPCFPAFYGEVSFKAELLRLRQ